MMADQAGKPNTAFVAYLSRLQLVAVTAGMLPIVVIAMMFLPLMPDAPLVVRIVGLLIISPVIVWLAINLRLMTMSGPVIEIDGRGLLWRRWSDRRIGWEAIERWQVKRHHGTEYVTFWLREPSQHRSTTIHRLLAPGNKALGMGDVTLGAGGTNRSFEELAAAVTRNAPPV